MALLCAKDEGCFSSRGASAGQSCDGVDEYEHTNCYERNRRNGHRGVGHGVDLAGEQNPQPTTESDAEGYAEEDAHHSHDRRLPRDGGRELALSETERLQ